MEASKLEMVEVIGEGGNGCVYRGEYNKSIQVAVKQLHRAQDREAFLRELGYLKSIRHPNVITLYGHVSTDDRELIVMELASFSLAEALKNGYPMRKTLIWASEAIRGLRCLHARNMAHMDIKPANILIDNNGVAKLGDLGLTCELKVGVAPEVDGGLVGTPAYMAPEQFQRVLGKIDAPRVDRTAVDMYAVGMLLWEVSHRQKPVPSGWKLPMFIKQVAENHWRPYIEEDVPHALKTTIRMCTQADPNQRPNCSVVGGLLDKIAPSQIYSNYADQNFTYWESEAKCFLSEGKFKREDDLSFSVHFADGQPSQVNIDPYNVLVEIEDLEHELFEPRGTNSIQTI